MSRAINYIEKVSEYDNDSFIETVTVSEAITACNIQEYETIKELIEHYNIDINATNDMGLLSEVAIKFKSLQNKIKNL